MVDYTRVISKSYDKNEINRLIRHWSVEHTLIIVIALSSVYVFKLKTFLRMLDSEFSLKILRYFIEDFQDKNKSEKHIIVRTRCKIFLKYTYFNNLFDILKFLNIF